MHATAALRFGRTGVPAMPPGRLLRAYAADAWYELLTALRAPAFAIPFLVLPIAVYLLFGVVMVGPSEGAPEIPGLANYLVCAFSVMGVMGPGLFGGVGLAIERDAGLFKLKRALPLPTGSYIVAKILMATVFAGIATLAVVATALVAGTLTLSAPRLIAMAAVLIVGAVPFSAMGLFFGAHFSGSASPAVVNLVYLPMLWLSGLFIPLPEALRPFAVMWPAFHLNAVAVTAAGLEGFTFWNPLSSAVVLVGVTVLFGGLAIRRLQRVG